MGEIVNLKRFRKSVDRTQAAQQAELNRVSHGRTKTERMAQSQRAERAAELLDQHQLDPGKAT